MFDSVLSGTIEVGDNVEFFYEDSGTAALKDHADYTTLVFIPGMGFNGSIFRGLFPHAPQQNCRIVGLYRRGFAPSSSCSAWNKRDTQEEGLKLEGLQLAKFLINFASSQSIPKINRERKSGGIILIGWSLGASPLHSLLAYLDKLEDHQLDTLQKYLYAVVSHDTSTIAHGIPNPIQHKGWSGDCDERFRQFRAWVTGYYTHPDSNSPDIKDHFEYDTPDPNLPASLHDVPEADFNNMTSIDMFAGPDLYRLLLDPALLQRLTRWAIFDSTRAQNLPNLKVRYICGKQTPGQLIYAMHKLEEAMKKDPSQLFGEGATKAREAKFTYLEEGNHFFFVDKPEWALEQYMACVESN
ncbi:hypothetical protein HYDPIDRAFT_111394 [Hydnomerulius pinastri MD-312]|uniref:AB hydrolase-1 domain-containing protein n=1 Tax=Hydnomerulius pinastri MD-312 TaxID=994086 RepID=A0A0C9W1L3_9AGAM|nr:hypothetical protein HYDPIDRAFT_111394 [Hydnomerulius pinastri MD-312]